MPLRRWRRLAQTDIFQNPWWTYRRDACELPAGGPGEYHYVHTNGSSLVIAVETGGTILMVNQYRYLAERESLEFPCGSVKEGHSYDTTAELELAEETGYSARKFLLAGEFNPYNGVTDEMCRVYIARDLEFVGQNPDETEEFELVHLGAAEIDEKIRNGSIWDGMSIAAWCVARLKLGG